MVNFRAKTTCCFHKYKLIVGFTLEARLVSSKDLIREYFEILRRSIKNMASDLLTKCISVDVQPLNLSIHQNLENAARAHRSNFLLVRCVLKSVVAHTRRRTSASLNYERFHGHQVKLKQVHFTLSLYVGLQCKANKYYHCYGYKTYQYFRSQNLFDIPLVFLSYKF